MSGFMIQCKCGHRAPFEDFTCTAAGIDLPPRTYQCRACGEAWAVRIVERGWKGEDGFLMPATLGCVSVQKTL